MSRRVLPIAAGLVLVLASLVGCGASSHSRTLSVLASWTGSEEQSFRAVLAAFTARTGIEVQYDGTRALDEVLADDVAAGTPPDVAVLPSAGELTRYVRSGSLVPLGGLSVPHAGAAWQRLGRLGTPETVAVPVKADLKGMVWYATARVSGAPPATLDDLVALSDRARGRGEEPWCLGMSAPPASGWPGTDWIEDILLHQAGPEVYEQWAAGQLDWHSAAVRRAWQIWTAIIGQGPTTARRALFTDFGAASRGMFANPPRCSLEHQASFAAPQLVAGDSAPRLGVDLGWFPFPPAAGRATPPPLASADLAAAFVDSPEARALMEFLASPEGQQVWPSHSPGAFSPSRDVPDSAYADTTGRDIAHTLTRSDTVCVDASDTMPTAMSSAFERAALEFLDDPGRLDAILDRLDSIRLGVPPDQWLTLPCGGLGA